MLEVVVNGLMVEVKVEVRDHQFAISTASIVVTIDETRHPLHHRFPHHTHQVVVAVVAKAVLVLVDHLFLVDFPKM